MNNPALAPGPGQRPPLPFTIVHAVPGRLRLRLPVLGQPHLDQAYLETWLEGTPGVQEVRINRAARSLVVIHDRDADVRARVLARLGAFDPAAGLPLLPEEGSGDEDEDIVPIARSLATLALLPCCDALRVGGRQAALVAAHVRSRQAGCVGGSAR